MHQSYINELGLNIAVTQPSPNTNEYPPLRWRYIRVMSHARFSDEMVVCAWTPSMVLAEAVPVVFIITHTPKNLVSGL